MTVRQCEAIWFGVSPNLADESRDRLRECERIFCRCRENSRKTGINPLRGYREAYRVVLTRGQGDGLPRPPAALVSHIGLPGFIARAAIFNIKVYRMSHRSYLIRRPVYKRVYPEPVHKAPNKVPNKLRSCLATGYCLAGELRRDD